MTISSRVGTTYSMVWCSCCAASGVGKHPGMALTQEVVPHAAHLHRRVFAEPQNSHARCRLGDVIEVCLVQVELGALLKLLCVAQGCDEKGCREHAQNGG